MRTIALTALIAGLSLSAAGCTPAAKTAIDQGIQIAVDTCTEIENFVPPTGSVGSVVGLICQGIDAGAPVAKIIIDSAAWTAMKQAYIVKHGALPKGMPVPAPASSAAGGK